jgi:arylsulfatase A-like enzyme
MIALLATAAWTATAAMALILAKSIQDFTRAGPEVRNEVLGYFRRYYCYAIVRLFFWGWLVCGFWSLVGAAAYQAVQGFAGTHFRTEACALAGAATLGLATLIQFCDQLLHKPSNICVSWQYRMNRLYGLWRLLSPAVVGGLRLGWRGGLCAILAAGALDGAVLGEWSRALLDGTLALALPGYARWLRRARAVPPPIPAAPRRGPPNIVMIGSDTLRVDHIGAAGYARPTTPFIDRLCRRGNFFTRCYTPLARTAPSLATLLTGTWPHEHGIRDNFVDGPFAELPCEALPSILRRHGYRSAAVADWCGSDLKKLSFDFDEVEAPEDQWNLKYYLRQGPMFLRLFLSLFYDNPIGERFIPEIYYQSGNPLNGRMADRACRKLHELAERSQPFFLNVFMACTHVPFGSEYPFYLRFAERAYRGESKFIMTTLRDPNEIIEKQEMPPTGFDLDQIVRLYDGCVRKFDTEVARIADYLAASGLHDNTLLVIYSDHGIEFFENQSWGQGNTVLGDDYGARIPLVVYDPRRAGAGTVGQIVRSVDLAPTLLDLCGLAVPGSMRGTSLKPALEAGVDLALTAYQETGIWLGNIPGLHPEHLRYPRLLELLEVPDKRSGTLAIKPQYVPLINRAKDRMIRKGKWKLTYRPLQQGVLYELFDTDDDPHCRKDVAEEYPAVVAELQKELAPWLLADGLEGTLADVLFFPAPTRRAGIL